ncbi:MAG: diacylglycerol kinase family lipid kinase [Prevotellaceae bacterium]|nr:diacylglycerol kinase family lipid kinase [Prevotellaceae bacterium]
MKEKIAFIINPVSGTADKKQIAEYIRNNADNDRFRHEIYFTTQAGDGFRLARQCAEAGFDRVIAVGGDGTVNEVARGLLRTDAALGIIPLGSGNGLARHIKMPLNWRKALETVKDGKVIMSDYGMLNDRPFFCTAGTGFDAQVGQRFSQIGRRGFFSYAQASFMEYLNYRPCSYKITTGDKTFSRRAFLITFANASQWGYNACISPDANISDGMIDLVIIYPLNIIKAPIIGLRMFTKSIYHSNNTEVIRIKDAVIEREKAGWIHIDGDPVSEDRIIRVKAVSGELKLITPSHR